MLMVYILIYILIYTFNNKQLRLTIKKQHIFLLRNDDLNFIYTFQFKSLIWKL